MIGRCAFGNCPSLLSNALPDNVIIDPEAFRINFREEMLRTTHESVWMICPNFAKDHPTRATYKDVVEGKCKQRIITRCLNEQCVHYNRTVLFTHLLENDWFGGYYCPTCEGSIPDYQETYLMKVRA